MLIPAQAHATFNRNRQVKSSRSLPLLPRRYTPLRRELVEVFQLLHIQFLTNPTFFPAYIGISFNFLFLFFLLFFSSTSAKPHSNGIESPVVRGSRSQDDDGDDINDTPSPSRFFHVTSPSRRCGCRAASCTQACRCAERRVCYSAFYFPSLSFLPFSIASSFLVRTRDRKLYTRHGTGIESTC